MRGMRLIMVLIIYVPDFRGYVNLEPQYDHLFMTL